MKIPAEEEEEEEEEGTSNRFSLSLPGLRQKALGTSKRVGISKKVQVDRSLGI